MNDGTRPRAFSPRGRERKAIVDAVATHAGAMTTATIAAMEARHDWYRRLDAEHRSWITIVARAGIDGFAGWLADDAEASPADVFAAAPRSLMRKVSLQQTVDLVRTTIDVVEDQLPPLVPGRHRDGVERALLRYSREIAFAAASIYARAAEMRGSWDARLEALTVDAIVRGEADDSVISRASALGWHTAAAACVVLGAAAASPDALDDARAVAARQRLDLLAAAQGDRLVLILGGEALATETDAVRAASDLLVAFGPGPVVVGPLVDHLVDARASARAAAAGARAAAGWAEAPRPVTATALLPERALSGDGHARRQLAREVYDPLAAAGGDLLATAVAFLDHFGSIEGTARALFVHPNTVRYRLNRVHDVTGLAPTVARDAYTLRLAIGLGRLLPSPPEPL